MPARYGHVSSLTSEHRVNGHSYNPDADLSPFEIRSHEVQDIMSRMPNIVVRQGTSVLVALIVLLFAGAYFIRFPEVVRLPVRVGSFVEAGKGYQARANLPIALAGKLRPGQRAIIKLPTHPFQQYGVLEGKVERLSAGSMDTAYKLEIQLPNALLTNTGKRIPADDYQLGTAEIITNDKSIAERLFERVLKNGKD